MQVRQDHDFFWQEEELKMIRGTKTRALHKAQSISIPTQHFDTETRQVNIIPIFPPQNMHVCRDAILLVACIHHSFSPLSQ